jgi:hypothetical protein
MDESRDPVVDGIVMLKETCSPCLSAKICLARSSKRGGRGLFAKEAIRAGEVVWRATGTPGKAYPLEEVMALPDESRKVFLHFAYCTYGSAVGVGKRRALGARWPCLGGRGRLEGRTPTCLTCMRPQHCSPTHCRAAADPRHSPLPPPPFVCTLFPRCYISCGPFGEAARV